MRARIFFLVSAVVLALALLGWPTTAAAQRSRGGGGGGGSRGGTATARSGGGGQTAAPRGGGQTSAPRGGGQATAPARPSSGGTRASNGGTYGAASAPDQARARQGRPVQGQAEPRTGGGPYTLRGGSRLPYYGYYPYGYGAFGLGYFYYDPFWGDYPYGGYGYGGYGYGPGYYNYNYGNTYDYGSLRLKVKPEDAEVYVDGYYVGQVGDFDGVFDHLDLEVGAHRIEIRAAGFEPLVFELRTLPGRTITYRGELQPVQK
jgi:hypothetical protein